MERREDIGAVLRGESPERSRAPSDLRERIEGAIGNSEPGNARVPGHTSRAPAAIGALAVVLAGAAVWVAVQPTPLAPAPAQQPAVVQAEDPPSPLRAMRAVAMRPDPLTQEAKQIWAELQRFRATVEGPVRSMAELGKSL